MTHEMYMGYYWLLELLKEPKKEQIKKFIRQHFLFALKSPR